MAGVINSPQQVQLLIMCCVLTELHPKPLVFKRAEYRQLRYLVEQDNTLKR